MKLNRLKFWKRNSEPTVAAAPGRPAGKVTLVLHGWNEAQMRHAFLNAPDSDLFRGMLEQCDRNLMETVNELVNHSEQLSEAQLRQRVGQLRGITELREQLEAREAQARKDQDATQKEEEVISQ